MLEDIFIPLFVHSRLRSDIRSTYYLVRQWMDYSGSAGVTNVGVAKGRALVIKILVTMENILEILSREVGLFGFSETILCI